ncbi:unnamed protein product [Vitrella brassicaformis CCMP3155]|uniref:EF-hand domain-containing protein n=2 Tax=Vitrella brassicaformis TaxID=1169539 RepID=A0A0G4EAR4_VITBC|nr:unnamed protein product [Vitrella brassicaformis CCMP3155]|eukprot:CEL92368.1 unnamed protein product [Vitrella brassicaformis CCMP3155]
MACRTSAITLGLKRSGAFIRVPQPAPTSVNRGPSTTEPMPSTISPPRVLGGETSPQPLHSLAPKTDKPTDRDALLGDLKLLELTPRRPNLQLVASFVIGEALLAAATFGTAYFVPFLDPFFGSHLDQEAVVQGVLWSLPLVAFGFLLDNLPWKIFKKIDRDTKFLVLALFGKEANLPTVALLAATLAGAAGFAEEALFRGTLLPLFNLPLFGGFPSGLLISSFLFGVAHSPVPGADAFLEAVYGLWFGVIYYMADGNIWVPMIAHAFYDFVTFLWVHVRATSRVKQLTESVSPEALREMEMQVRESLPAEFARFAKATFQMLDLDGSGGITKEELRLGLRVFSNRLRDEDVDNLFAAMDRDGSGQIDFNEFLSFVTKRLVIR